MEMVGDLAEALGEFLNIGLRVGIKPPFEIVRYSERKGIVVLKDSSGKTIEGKRQLVKGQIKWVLSVSTTRP